MALTDGQVQIRNLVMGPGTPYTLRGFNPFGRNVRADQGGARAWDDGTWSGAEFLDETTIPIRILTRGGDRSAGAWLTEHLPLQAAFDAVKDGIEDVELRFNIGGTEYIMFGRPRMIDPDTEIIGTGKAMTEAAFTAVNPRIYSALQQTVSIALASFSSGLVIPMVAPIYLPSTKIGGEVEIENQGLAETPLLLRIDGPVGDARVALSDPDGTVHVLAIGVSLTAEQFIIIDTGSRKVLLNGISNNRNKVSGDFALLQPGTSGLFFQSSDFNETARLTATWRYAW